MAVINIFHLVLLCINVAVHGQQTTRLLFSDGSTILLIDTESGNVTTLATGYKWVLFLAYHYENSLIFWSDMDAGTITRLSYPSDEAQAPTTIIKGIHPTGLAVDYIQNHLYWADTGYDKIFKSELDGSNITVEFEDLGHPLNLEVDSINRWLYSQVDNNRIVISRLDRSDGEVQNIFTGSSENFVVDTEDGRIYWTDYNSLLLQSALLNGSDVQTVFDFSPHRGTLMGIALDRSSIYFSDWSAGKLYEISRQNEQPELKLLYTSNYKLMSIKVYKPSYSKCSNFSTITNEERRSANYTIPSSDEILYNDHELEHKWYRVESLNGEEIPNYPPGDLHCGTNKPIWINGSLPEVTNENSSIQACVQTSTDTCEETFEIDVIKCSSYYLYHLVNTTENAAYCFGNGPVLCPPGQSSYTGFYPNCTSSFPNETVTLVVRAILEDGPPIIASSSSLLPVFRCEFVEESDSSYVYDVYWYINGDEVVVHRNVYFSNISFTNLRGSQWLHKHHMNMEVWCSVRVRLSVGSVPSPFHRSPTFKAGLFPDRDEYYVVEGDSINITLTATVPVGCISSNINFRDTLCGRNIFSFVPTTASSTDDCSNNVAKRDILFRSFSSQSCGTVLDTINGTQVKTLQAFGFVDGKYNYKDRSTYIRLSTKPAVEPADIDVWKNLTLTDIKVNIIDRDTTLAGRLCQCYNDPHFRTFDGRVYHYMEVGEFALYKNERGPYWVHALFSNCGFGWSGSSCNCGVAVRSRNSLFVIRTCKTVSRTNTVFLTHPHIERRSCDESDFSIIIKGNHYTIKLPIGTEIQFSVRSSNFIPSISIKPSIYDISVARGLCGVPSINKDATDDFVHKHTHIVVDEKSFADSWRISPNDIPNEQLFIAEPSYLFNIPSSDNDRESNNNKGNSSAVRYCVCEREAGSTDDLGDFSSFHCNLTEPTESCLQSTQSSGTPNGQNTISALPTSCSVTVTRRKRSGLHHHVHRRSLDDSDDVIEPEAIEFDGSVESNSTINETLEFKNGWTEETARETCERQLNNTVPTEILDDTSGINDTHYIESCILDIKMTASTVFVEDTVGAMQTYTLIEVLRNETLENSTTENGSQTILEYVTSQLCPGNCNKNGNCTLGICYCFAGFYGEDCTGTTSTPPQNYSLPTSGLCGTRSRACQRTNIYGNFPSDNVWCRKRHFKISGNVTTYAENYTVERAVYRNQFMVSVDITPPSVNRRKRSINGGSMAEGYEMSLSNDGNTFGESVNILIYDEECSDCNSSSMVCVSVSSCPDYTTTETSTLADDMTTVQSSTQHTTTEQDATTQLSTNDEISTRQISTQEYTTTQEEASTTLPTEPITKKEATTTLSTEPTTQIEASTTLSTEPTTLEEASNKLSTEPNTDETTIYESSEEKSTTTPKYTTNEQGLWTSADEPTTLDSTSDGIDIATTSLRDTTTLLEETSEAKNKQSSKN